MQCECMGCSLGLERLCQGIWLCAYDLASQGCADVVESAQSVTRILASMSLRTQVGFIKAVRCLRL